MALPQVTVGLVALWCSARQATEEGWVTMHAILMCFMRLASSYSPRRSRWPWYAGSSTGSPHLARDIKGKRPGDCGQAIEEQEEGRDV